MLLVLVGKDGIEATNGFASLFLEYFSDLNIFDIGEPDVVVFVFEEFEFHLEDLNLSHFLEVVAYFETLLLTVVFVVFLL